MQNPKRGDSGIAQGDFACGSLLLNAASRQAPGTETSVTSCLYRPHASVKLICSYYTRTITHVLIAYIVYHEGGWC